MDSILAPSDEIEITEKVRSQSVVIFNLIKNWSFNDLQT